MSFTRREFLRLGGPGIAAGSFIASLRCSQTPPGPVKDAGASTWDERVATLEDRIRRSMQDLRVPGASVAIIRDARIAWKKGFGVRDRSTSVPVDDDTVFSAQSMSKPVFAYRVMKLSEQGVLDLDAPLTRYTHDVFVKNDPRLKEITARRVLSHTTGLPNWRSKEDPLRDQLHAGNQVVVLGRGLSLPAIRGDHADRAHR